MQADLLQDLQATDPTPHTSALGQAPLPIKPDPDSAPMALDTEDDPAAASAADAVAATAADVLAQSLQTLQEMNTSCSRPAHADSTSRQSGSRKGHKAPAEPPSGSKAGPNAANANKGLRQFALLVCEQVRAHGRTTYNEVADVLVSKLGDNGDGGPPSKDVDKTIRRRVYDAINVLMATDIIQREKKEITWKGLPSGCHGLPGLSRRDAAGPSTSADAGPRSGASGSRGPGKHDSGGSGATEGLRQQKERKMQELSRKQQYLQDLLDQHMALKHLVARNKAAGTPPGTSIHLPFVLIQAGPTATVQVDITEDMQQVAFDIHNSPIQLHDDSMVVRQILKHTQGQAAAGQQDRKPPQHGPSGKQQQQGQQGPGPTWDVAMTLPFDAQGAAGHSMQGLGGRMTTPRSGHVSMNMDISNDGWGSTRQSTGF